MWVVSWLRQLDYGQRAFRRTEEPLRNLALTPSEYVRRHLKFTPFPGEPVGWMIEQAGPELFMFSSDYPHPEGGKDPLAKFRDELGTTGADARGTLLPPQHDGAADGFARLTASRGESATAPCTR